MHKGIILLVKETDKDVGLDKVKEFLEQYGDGVVWDWYQIGGRWTQNLAPKYDEFEKKAKKILENKKDKFTSQDKVNKNQDKLQKIWKDLKMTGRNPYTDHYKLPEYGGDYDILPLTKCIDKVIEWGYNFIKKGKEELKEAEKWLNGEYGKKTKKGNKKVDDKKVKDYSMYGYALKKAGEIFQQNFCFDCNVFNIETYNYSIPKDIKNYMAVMIDIHN